MWNFLFNVFLIGSWLSPYVGANKVFNSNDYYIHGEHGNLGEILLNKQYDFDINPNNTRGEFEKHGYKFEFDDGNPDIHGTIERPCQAYDTFCIRKYFAEHSRCKISGRRLPDPIHRAQSVNNYPSANISAVGDNPVYTGLNAARVVEFYIDKVTDNLVIALHFDAVTQISNDTYFKFHLKGREPEVHQGFAIQVYEKITITMIIPGLNDLRLDRAEIYTYAENPLIPFVISPSLLASSDPEVVAMGLFLATVDLQKAHLEELSTEGVYFGANYLQYNICDFGLKVL